MGSFAAPVDLPEQLRPWALAGLELLLLPDGPVYPAPPAEPCVPQPTTTAPAQNAPEPVRWIAPWDALAARVKTPPRVIITYASLADDVAVAADPARRKLFQSILSYLAWPLGTSLFWPISFPTGVDPGPLFAVDVFAAGVRHFGIKHVLCFGRRTADKALLLFPQEGQTPEVRVHVAPATDDLVGLLPHELHRAMAFLKELRLG